MTTLASRARTASPWLLAGLLVGAATLHLVRPEPFDSIVPGFLPSPRTFTYVSGLAELAVAGAVVRASTREHGGLAAAVLFVAVFPANVFMVVEPGGVPRWLAIARLPLQLPLVLWGLQVRSAARRGVLG